MDHPPFIVGDMEPGATLRCVVLSAEQRDDGSLVLTLLAVEGTFRLTCPPSAGYRPSDFPAGSALALETEQRH